MQTDHLLSRALNRAIAHLLRPLFRVLLRHQVSFGAFEEMAKRVYVDVAARDFGIEGKKSSISRVSILSGLTRKEVQRLMHEPAEVAADASERYNRASRVMTGWVRDTDFQNEKGEPRALSADGERSFATLVKRYSGDMPARAVLDELKRVGAVHQYEDGRLETLTRAYVPQNSAIDKIDILGVDVADLISTIDHNLEHGDAAPMFQRKVMYDSIPVGALPEFRKLSAAQAQALLEKFDRWLAARDIEHVDAHATSSPATARARVGVGIYYFEERLEAPASTGVSP